MLFSREVLVTYFGKDLIRHVTDGFHRIVPGSLCTVTKGSSGWVYLSRKDSGQGLRRRLYRPFGVRSYRVVYVPRVQTPKGSQTCESKGSLV